MKLLPLVACSVAVLASATFAAACSDSSDSLTLEEYFAGFEAIEADIGEQIGALYDGIPDDFDEFADASVVLVKEFFASFASIARDGAEREAALKPPAEAQDAHNEVVAANENLVTLINAASESVNEVETMAEFTAAEIEFQPGIDAAFMRADEACFELVLVADANGITVADVICLGDD